MNVSCAAVRIAMLLASDAGGACTPGASDGFSSAKTCGNPVWFSRLRMLARKSGGRLRTAYSPRRIADFLIEGARLVTAKACAVAR